MHRRRRDQSEPYFSEVCNFLSPLTEVPYATKTYLTRLAILTSLYTAGCTVAFPLQTSPCSTSVRFFQPAQCHSPSVLRVRTAGCTFTRICRCLQPSRPGRAVRRVCVSYPSGVSGRHFQAKEISLCPRRKAMARSTTGPIEAPSRLIEQLQRSSYYPSPHAQRPQAYVEVLDERVVIRVRPGQSAPPLRS
jgi:hypothetical protein